MVRAALAAAAAAAIVVSAPFVQYAFTTVSARFPAIGPAAAALPIAVAILAAVVSIRDRRPLRYAALALSVVMAAAYAVANSLSFTERFHFVEYGALACLVYVALVPSDDGSLLVLPFVAGLATGIVDEWFQWFIPIRVGELRDITLDAVASLCGVLFALSLNPPRRLTMAFARRSSVRVGLSVMVTLALFALFVLTVHVGYEVRDPDIGVFASRYTAAQLSTLSQDRSARWRSSPPVTVRWFSREDQYLSEGLWHVQLRNEAWEAGDIAAAWRENLILETFFSRVLDVPTYATPSTQRWSAEQRADAASRPGIDRRPQARADYRYPLLVF
jgi:hypothetical protein